MKKKRDSKRLFLTLLITIILCFGFISISYAQTTTSQKEDTFLSKIFGFFRGLILGLIRPAFGEVNGYGYGQTCIVKAAKVDVTNEGEQPIEGWSMTIDGGDTKTTDGDGFVQWERTCPGEYLVEEEVQDGWTAINGHTQALVTCELPDCAPDTELFENCQNECDPEDYPACKDDRTVERCVMQNDGCYHIEEDTCPDAQCNGHIYTPEEKCEGTPAQNNVGCAAQQDEDCDQGFDAECRHCDVAQGGCMDLDIDCGTCCMCENGLKTADLTQDGDCSGASQPEVATCFNDPDNNSNTYDYKPEFTSYCIGVLSCAQDPEDYTHTCTDNDPYDTVDGDMDQCGAECDENSDCNPYCTGDIYNYMTECNNDEPAQTCACVSLAATNCNTLSDWEDTGNTQWISTGECTEKQQKEQEYRDYYCDVNSDTGCSYDITGTQWVDTGLTRAKADGTACDDNLYCTVNDQCTTGICSGSPRTCSDGVGCTDDSCNEDIDQCINTPNDANCQADIWEDTGNTRWISTGECTEKQQKEQEYRDYYCDSTTDCQYDITDTRWVDTGSTRAKADGTPCNDGLACTENDQCTLGICSGTKKDCLGNNILGVAECYYNPDGIPYTWDYRESFTSECQEPDGTCTTGDDTIMHECHDNDPNDGINGNNCSAECDQDSDCASGYTCSDSCVCVPTGADDDGDGVSDDQDKCPNTIIPEGVPTDVLRPNNYAQTDSDTFFETNTGSAANPFITDSGYTIVDTYGCSCEQILFCKPGQDVGEQKWGCTEGTMNVWISQTGWAPDCQVNGIVIEGEAKGFFEDSDGAGFPDIIDGDNDNDGIGDNDDSMEDDSDPPGTEGHGKPDWWERSKGLK
ncbi:hypothetical protein KY343_02835 [Candidatus Woesearchaeota archaeon]|nr:hypothetical protein [Candidatus Woesearchaeota archaeon]